MKLLKRFRELTLKDYISLLYLPLALLLSPFYIKKNHHLILICEDENGARDNGYWLFKYICERHPEQRVAYVINKQSPDYQKVRNLGEIVQWSSLKHWIYYLTADINASTQKGGKPNAAVFYVLEVVLKILKNKRVFLQHGVTINDCKWLYYNETQMRAFICGAKPEYDAVSSQFGYPEGYVQYLGLTRFDNWHDIQVNKKQILLIPSWREWLVTKVDAYYEFKEDQHFPNSEYYRKWNEFLTNSHLLGFLEEHDLTLIFYPHRNIQPYLSHFERKSDNIVFANWEDYDIQDLLKESAFMITDYSSVFMDFAYMKKPMVFYQFDEAKFRKAQYQKGYFDYVKDGFGEVVFDSPDNVVEVLEKSYQQKFTLSDDYLRRVDEFFPLYDRFNCKRNYEYVKTLLGEK